MKYIKNYMLALAILSLSANILPLRGRVAAFAVGTSVGRNRADGNYQPDKMVSKQITRHEAAIAKNNKELSSKKLDKELDAELKKQRKQELLNSNREHEEAIQDLMKK